MHVLAPALQLSRASCLIFIEPGANAGTVAADAFRCGPGVCRHVREVKAALHKKCSCMVTMRDVLQ